MRRDRAARAVSVLEWTLLAVGVGCLSGYVWMSREVDRLETASHAAVSRMLAERGRAPQPSAVPPSALSEAPALDALSVEGDPLVIGELDIPRLRLSAAVMLGDDSSVLRGAVGYLPDTSLPWEHGNSAFAAHRDRLFRPLANIQVGDEILLSTRHGDFQYRVSHTFIVNPGAVWVLDPAPDVDLTLITCYPFVFVGHAPQRFVVRATKVRPWPGAGGPSSADEAPATPESGATH